MHMFLPKESIIKQPYNIKINVYSLLCKCIEIEKTLPLKTSAKTFIF